MFGYKKEIYKAKMNLIDKSNITNLRERVNILIVDDEDDNVVQALLVRKYNVFYKADMSYAIEAEPFDIIFLDIKGVAKRLQSNMEGFQLAKEIKLKYPLKQVYCYSGTIQPAISEELAQKRIDGFIKKDTEVDKWGEKLDQIIRDYVDADKQWEIIRKELLKNSASENEIKIIRDVFYDSIKKGAFPELYSTVMGIVKNTTAVLGLLNGILGLMKILVA